MNRFVLFCALSVTAGCTERAVDPSRFQPRATEQELIVELFGTEANLQLVREASVVSAFRLHHEDAGKRYITPNEYVAGPAVALTTEQVERAKKPIADPRYYYFDNVAKACGDPIFGVRFRFERGSEYVDVNLCFRCEDLLVTKEGKEVGWADFGRARPELAQLCKEVFPGDREISELR